MVVEHDQNGIKPVTYEVLNAAGKLADSITALYFTNDADVDSKPHADDKSEQQTQTKPFHAPSH